MAFKEVDPGPLPELAPFFKFVAIGDKFGGVFQSYEEADGTYGTEQRYTFRNREGTHVITANFDLHRRLKKAELKPGHRVMIVYVADIPNPKADRSPMRQFKVLVDRDAPAAKAPPPPVNTVDDDLDF